MIPRWLRRLFRLEVDSEQTDAAVADAEREAKRLRLEQQKVKANAHAVVAAERRRTDTRRRVVAQKADSMSSVFLPRDGKSIEQLAAEELEREEARQRAAGTSS